MNFLIYLGLVVEGFVVVVCYGSDLHEVNNHVAVAVVVAEVLVPYQK